MPKNKDTSFEVTYRQRIGVIFMNEGDASEHGRTPEERAIAMIAQDDSDGTYEFEVPMPNDSYYRSVSYAVEVSKNLR